MSIPILNYLTMLSGGKDWQRLFRYRFFHYALSRFLLINDMRFGERRLERMIDRCGALALPKGATLPADWPLPETRWTKYYLSHWEGLSTEPPRPYPQLNTSLARPACR